MNGHTHGAGPGRGMRGAGRGGRWARRGRSGSGLHAGTALCTLDTLSSGDEVEILGVDDEHARIHALRFGMAEGSHATCVTRIPAGPIVMRSGRQEIAVGRRLARRIRVRRVGDELRKAV